MILLVVWERSDRFLLDPLGFRRLCEKISVKSKTVIKNI